MNETMLDERIHALAAAIPAPAASAYDDLARGRRRERRRRSVLVGGLGAVTVAAAAGVVLGPGTSDQAAAPTHATAEPPGVVPRSADGARADGAISLRDLRAVTDALEDRIAGPLGWLSVGTADSWAATGADACPTGWTCTDADVRGASRARWADSGTVHQLVVELDGQVSLFTVNQADERPGSVAWQAP